MTYEQLVRSYVTFAVDLTIDLGICRFRLVSNEPAFLGMKYFSKHTQRLHRAVDSVDFELFCISSKSDRLKQNMELTQYLDNTCRSHQFLDGYYVTDHFGPPIYLISRGNSFFVFGDNLERVMWSYFVKYFLQLQAIKNHSLFLKAAAMSVRGKGVLLLGRGGAGKTVFLSSLCLNGADFISNSHVIIHNKIMSGIASSMRMRPHDWNHDLLAKTDTIAGEKEGEQIVDPYAVFTISNRSVRVQTLCILRYDSPSNHIIQPISHDDAYGYAEQFGLGINVYRLEEDILDYFSNDVIKFSKAYLQMQNALKRLVYSCNCYFISSNILDEERRADILTLLQNDHH